MTHDWLTHEAPTGFARLQPRAGSGHQWRHGDLMATRARPYAHSDAVTPRFQELLRRMSDDLRLRNYSARTEAAYVVHIMAVFRHFGVSPEELSLEDIRSYLLHLVNVRQCSWSWWKQAVGALRFFYGNTLGRTGIVPYLPFPKREVHLPVVLSTSEVATLLNTVTHLKHRTILMTIYGSGLRLSEARTLATSDIDTSRMVIHVRQGKGRKDRYVPLSHVLLDALQDYWATEGKGVWAFPGRNGMPIRGEPVQVATREAARRAGLPKRVSPRTLRHCFATHLMESGTDLLTIQKLLGHSSLNATVVYTHISQHRLISVRSPLDDIAIASQPRQLALEGLG